MQKQKKQDWSEIVTKALADIQQRNEFIQTSLLQLDWVFTELELTKQIPQNVNHTPNQNHSYCQNRVELLLDLAEIEGFLTQRKLEAKEQDEKLNQALVLIGKMTGLLQNVSVLNLSIERGGFIAERARQEFEME
jgi:hypothetical protein